MSKDRLEYLRGQIRGSMAELGPADQIDPTDVELLELGFKLTGG